MTKHRMTWGEYRQRCLNLAKLFADNLDEPGLAQYWEDQANSVQKEFYGANMTAESILIEYWNTLSKADILQAKRIQEKIVQRLGNSVLPSAAIQKKITQWQGEVEGIFCWYIFEPSGACQN